MSAFHQYDCPITDQDELVESLQVVTPKFRGHVEVHDTAQPLFGYQGDQRKDKAHIIVRRQYVGGASNDLGFLRQEDGTFKAVISNFDRGQYGEAWMGKLRVAHNQTKAVNILRQKGFNVTVVTDEKNGHRKVRMERQQLLGR